MLPVTRSRFVAAVAGLVAGPVLAGVSVLTQPDLGGSPREQLAAIADSPLGAVSAVAFLVSQLPLLVAFLAIGRMLLPRAPRLSAWGTALAVVGCFGHIVFGGITMVYVVMAHDPAHRAVYARLMGRLQDSPVMLFSAAGLLGTVLGVMVLGIGIFRTRTGPVWTAPALWAFLVVEFVGTAVSPMASYLSVGLLLAAFGALASTLVSARRRSPAADPSSMIERQLASR